MYSKEELDLARLAMCIDCEGCIAIRRLKVLTQIQYSIAIQIGNNELRLIEWLCTTFGFSLGIAKTSKVNGYESKTGIVYICSLSASKASSLLKLVRPYLSIKGRKADLAISMQDTMGVPHHKPSEETYLLRESIYQESKKTLECLVTIREGEPLFDKFNGKVKELV